VLFGHTKVSYQSPRADIGFTWKVVVKLCMHVKAVATISYKLRSYHRVAWSGRFGCSWRLSCGSCVMKSFRWSSSVNVNWYNCDTSATRKHLSCSQTSTHRSQCTLPPLSSV